MTLDSLYCYSCSFLSMCLKESTHLKKLYLSNALSAEAGKYLWLCLLSFQKNSCLSIGCHHRFEEVSQITFDFSAWCHWRLDFRTSLDCLCGALSTNLCNCRIQFHHLKKVKIFTAFRCFCALLKLNSCCKHLGSLNYLDWLCWRIRYSWRGKEFCLF